MTAGVRPTLPTPSRCRLASWGRGSSPTSWSGCRSRAMGVIWLISSSGPASSWSSSELEIGRPHSRPVYLDLGDSTGENGGLRRTLLVHADGQDPDERGLMSKARGGGRMNEVRDTVR